MKTLKEFPFHKARRVTRSEVVKARKAIAQKLGKKRRARGRPQKLEAERYQATSIRLHPKVLGWAKTQAHKRHIGYQTVINEALLSMVIQKR
ncbi:MAG: BrnA antitoxin family protein [Deltaproteobacteria bacterium]|nr:BrnA antitoxin family protein [Deltaproteobacteria bacterium]